MATASDVITDVLRRMRIIAGGEPVNTNDGSLALSLLNDELESWTAKGLTYTHTTLALADAVSLDDAVIGSLKKLLVPLLWPYFRGKDPLPSLLSEQAQDAWIVLQAQLITRTDMEVDEGLQRLPSQYGNVGNIRHFN